jgi:dipeptidase D
MPIEFFKQITKIPRPSGSEEKILEYLKNLAMQNSWHCEVDEFNNVLIKKQNANIRPLILQAHTDMVCVSEEKDFDFENKSITLLEKDGYFTADRTSLGADNGVGVALALAMLKEDLPMNLEVLFTSEEETTMQGANNFDTSKLKGKHMISLDGSAKATVDISSASSTIVEFDLGGTKKFHFANKSVNPQMNIFQLEISGLIGGHSGVDVDKNLGNAFKIMIDFLADLEDISILSLDAKSKSNEIPTNCKVSFATQNAAEELKEKLKTYFADVFNSCNAPNLKINLKTISFVEENIQGYLNSKVIIDFLKMIEFGVLEQNKQHDVILSSNLYEINLDTSKVKLHVRANQEEFREDYISKIERLGKRYGFELKEKSYLPGFSAKKDGELLRLITNSCEKVFGKKPTLENIHAGVECGVFASKIKDLDVCVIGAKIDNMHSTKERVEIKSIEETFNWLKEIIKNFK